MPAIRFDKEHRTRGVGEIIRHADEAYFTRGIVFVKPETVEHLDKMGIPYHVLSPKEIVKVVEDRGGKGKTKGKKTLRSKASN